MVSKSIHHLPSTQLAAGVPPEYCDPVAAIVVVVQAACSTFDVMPQLLYNHVEAAVVDSKNGVQQL